MDECCGACVFMAECAMGKYFHKNNGDETWGCPDFTPDDEVALAESREFCD